MDKPFSSWVQWDNTVCNPLAPAREQTQSAWQHGYESGVVDGMRKQAQEPRQWQGLTDEEIDTLFEAHHNQYGECEVAGHGYERAIEAKLKEKNHG